MIAHAAIGQVFDIPVIMSTSADEGPNGPLPQQILDMYPSAPLIQRQGEVNAWDNPEFRAAIESTGRRQVIVAGITTDVCALPSIFHLPTYLPPSLTPTNSVLTRG